MKRGYDARAVVLMLFFVSLCRMILEVSALPQIRVQNCYARLLVYIPFYLVMFFSFTLLLRLTARLPFEKAANPVAVGLLFGAAPPVIDYFIGTEQPRYQYFRQFEPFLTADYLPIGESIVLWMLVLTAAVFTYYLTRSVWRAAAAALGAYVIIQVHGFLLEWLICQRGTFTIQGPIRGVILSEVNLLISLVIYVLFRGRPVLASILRSNHALPHFMLALCGAAWAGQGFGIGAIKGVIVLAFFVFLLMQNDYYDQREDRLAARPEGTTRDDVTWSTFFIFCLVFPLAQVNFMMVLLLVVCLLTGFLYHHPAVRLKERFCLSYKAEGVWALMAFLIGASAQAGFQGQDLLVASLLVFGGGALISIPKDWKDVESDRLARIPTYYVLLTNRGLSEYGVHRGIVFCVTLGLLIPPILVFAWKGFSALGGVLLVSSLVPAWALLSLSNRKRAVETMLWALSGYLLLLALLLRSYLG